MFRILVSLVLVIISLRGYAQMEVDSLVVKEKFRLTDTQAYQICYVGVPLIAEGVIACSYKQEVKGIRDEYAGDFSCGYDDYFQFLPGVTMLGLKAAGVESRSSWSRMIVSDIFSVAILSSSVYLLKSGCGVMRPDGSTPNSFPSGHTATAFAAATMLHKEYGKVSPWYSVGGYAVAVATGVGRVLNNRHWVSDVLAGAGIGIISTELGYWITDMIFKDRGLNDIQEYEFDGGSESFLGLYLGLTAPFGSYSLGDNSSLKLKSGADVGAEGAYYLNRYVGVGGDVTFADMFMECDGELQREPLNMFMCHAGGYVSYPLLNNLSVGGKGVFGYVNYADTMMDDGVSMVGGCDGFSLKGGVSLAYRASDYFSVRVFADYCMNVPFVDGGSRKATQLMSFGNTLSIAF